MDTSTGNIFTKEEMDKMIKKTPHKAKFMKMIPIEYEEKMLGMNRAERRRFYREHKKDFLNSG